MFIFTTIKQFNRRQIRWAELLEQYKFKILYTPEKENSRADILSRRKDLITKESTDGTILKKNKDGFFLSIK